MSGGANESICVVGDTGQHEVHMISHSNSLGDNILGVGQPGVSPASGGGKARSASAPVPHGGQHAGLCGHHCILQPSSQCGAQPT